MDKQIKELDTELRMIVKGSTVKQSQYSKFGGFDGYTDIFVSDIATALYNAGYRQINEYNEVVSATIDKVRETTRKETVEKIADWLDNEKGYCGLGYLVKQKFCTEGKR